MSWREVLAFVRLAIETLIALGCMLVAVWLVVRGWTISGSLIGGVALILLWRR